MILKALLCSLCGAVLTWLIIDKVVKAYIRRKVNKAKKKVNKDNEFLREVWELALISGFMEIFLYCGSMIIGKPEFIALWIGIKTALRWDRKVKKDKPEKLKKDKLEKTKEENSEVIIIQRGTYHTFLLGNGLTIIFGYLSAYLVTGKFIPWD